VYWAHVFLLDEPTNGADPITTSAIMHHIKPITGDSPIASSVVTHDVSVERSADRAAHLLEGAVIWEGSPAEMNRTDNGVLQQFVTGSLVGPIPL
jgi:phospholipid/cholesterol/gamma-HCH transport system ATP-binding protein